MDFVEPKQGSQLAPVKAFSVLGFLKELDYYAMACIS
jgi:hypothetical protein